MQWLRVVPQLQRKVALELKAAPALAWNVRS
jgi:hypothetical protein